MKNSKTLFQEVVASITVRDSPEEIRSVAHLLLEHFYGISRTDIVAGKMVAYAQESATPLQRAIGRINEGEPVQYVVGEADFFGRRFHVNPSVLIPRPETEELIRAVVAYKNTGDLRYTTRPLRILDIGTGSGCISVTLYHEIFNAEIFATDVSTAALSVAVDNAENLHAKITFIENDVLKEKIPVSGLDVVVSNPPYVMEKERAAMKRNVTDYEPYLALFVPDKEPLLFYKAIVKQAKDILKDGGLLAVEINEKFGDGVAGLFKEEGFHEVDIMRDLAGKPRVVKAARGRLETP